MERKAHGVHLGRPEAQATARGLLGLAIVAAALSGCAASEGPPEVGVAVRWLTGEPAAALPADVTAIRLIRWQGGSATDTTITPAGLSEAEDGTRYSAPNLLRRLPAGEPLEVWIEAGSGAGAPKYVGFVGPLVLRPGERRYVDLAVFETGTSVAADASGMPARFLHAAAALPDGRVLVTGGFTAHDDGAACPAGLPTDSRCFELQADDGAFLYEPSTGRFHPTRLPMLEPRAGHTMTALPGGRVLVAGGAPRAVLAFAPLGDVAMPRGYAVFVAPQDGAGADTALATFEIFEPGLDAEAQDLDADGDPARGGFTGAGGGRAEAGLLDDSRFLHAATPVPGEAARVLLVGGMGAGSASYEVFDDQKPGGAGVYANDGAALGYARLAPSAVTLSDSVWIFGGNLALGNDMLAEVWTPGADPNGSVGNATETMFPDDGAGMPRPELSHLRPSVAAVGGGSHALVVGWYGPRCAPGTSDPVFPATADGAGTEPCGPSGGPARSVTVSGADGSTRTIDALAARGVAHAFASVATLSDGRVAVTGGIANALWNRQQAIEIFSGAVVGGQADLSTSTFDLNRQRVFHTTTALPHGGLLSVGGVYFGEGLATLSLEATAEVLYLPREAASLTAPPME